jgi:hypothetical protein
MSETNEPRTNEDNVVETEATAGNGEDPVDREIREDRLMAFMEVKFAQMQEESEGLKRKLKRQDERQVKFSKKGHEVQYEFNNEVLEAIEAIQDGLARQRTTKAKKLLEELAKKVSHRNKLIKIADRSKFGWLTVAEYQKDQLAEDSDDEKRLKTSEKMAEKVEKEKKSAKEKVATRQPPNPVRDFTRRPTATFSSKEQHERYDGGRFRNAHDNSTTGSGGTLPRFRNAPQPSSQGYYSSSPAYSSRRGYNRQCFTCGSYDHVRRDCPY